MGNPYPIEIATAESVVSLRGAATFTDPANQPGGGGSVLSHTVTLLPAALLTLASVPVDIVPAVATHAVIPVGCVFRLVIGTTPYLTAAGKLAVVIGGTTQAVISDAILTAGVNQLSQLKPVDPSFDYGDQSAFAGAALQLTDDTADPTLGDGSLEVTTYYVVVVTP